MAEQVQGFDQDMFTTFKGDLFDCFMCRLVANNPQECTSCGVLYCLPCLSNFRKETMYNNCTQCDNPYINPLNPDLKSVYEDLDIQCSCGAIMKVGEFSYHIAICQAPQCRYNKHCGNGCSDYYIKENLCDSACKILDIVISNKNDWKKITLDIKDIIGKIEQKQLPGIMKHNIPIKPPSTIGGGNEKPPPTSSYISGPSKVPLFIPEKSLFGSVTDFSWDNQKIGTNIVLGNSNQRASLNEQGYVFKTIISNTPLTSGVHYWEIAPDKSTENELQIGVSLKNDFNLETAFCDHDFGFAYYTLGQLRNGSNAQGGNYGKKFQNTGVCGICLDMNKGCVSFFYDGEFLGVAFSSNQFKSGKIYPAVALLHNASLLLITNKSVPSNYKV